MSPQQVAELGLLKAAAWVVIGLSGGISAMFFGMVRRMAKRIIDGDGNGGASLRKLHEEVGELRAEQRATRAEVAGLPCQQGPVCHLHDASAARHAQEGR